MKQTLGVIIYELYFCLIMRGTFLKLFVLIVGLALAVSSCKDDNELFTSSDVELAISADTIVFDTVFTSFNTSKPLSVNKQFVVVNPHNKTVKSSFRLGKGASSFFRFNVDGEIGPLVSEILIEPNDSVFVFLELSIEPNQDPKSRPLIITDSIIVSTNGVEQDINLVAWGQDAFYYDRDTLCNVVLDDQEKPYVVYGYMYVPENCNLTIKEGVTLHFAPNSWLFVEGTLNIEGKKDNPVKFEGDRLQPDYEEVAGQWGGIWMDYLSKDNTINYAEIKNGTVGIYCDSSSSNNKPTVIVTNTMVRNMLFDGLSGKGSFIRAENSVFANCGRYTFLGLWGGDYGLKHCTFITYNFDFNRRQPTFVFNSNRYNELQALVETYDIKAQIENSIIYGSLDEEMAIDLADDRVELLTIHNNLIKTKQDKFINTVGINNILNEHLGIVDYQNHKYQIDSSSKAIDIGKILTPPIILDLNQNNRDSKPDAGAFEYVP